VVIARAKFAFPVDEITALLAMIRRQGELIGPKATTAVSIDPGDAKFLRYAKTARVDYIVTGNKRHFPEATYDVTRVVSASELLDWITLEL
jgi:uncharacterized protein